MKSSYVTSVVRSLISVVGATCFALAVARGADAAQPSEKQKAEALSKLQAAVSQTLKPVAKVPTTQATLPGPTTKPGQMQAQSLVGGNYVTAVSLAKLKSLASSEDRKSVV